MEQVW